MAEKHGATDLSSLAKALDQEIEDHIDSLEKKPYTEGFSEENWEKEIENVPLFMTKSPNEADYANNPALAAIQKIKYDEDSTPVEKAQSYKEEGNQYFKERDYRKAVFAYTEALKENFDDDLLKVILLTNRAAAQFHIENYQSCMMDVARAKKLKPDHLKALIRGAECLLKLRKYEKCLDWCDMALKISPTDKKLLETRTLADQGKRKQERDERIKAKKMKQKAEEKRVLETAIQQRGITIKNIEAPEDYSEGSGHEPIIDSDGVIHWPVLFLYPEYAQSDIIADFNENHRFVEHLNEMFKEDEYAGWDAEKKYRAERIEIYYEDMSSRKLNRVMPDMTLAEAITMKGYTLHPYTPHFIILVAGSPFKDHYFENFARVCQQMFG
ncbi:tetratricopeptide repeat protein 4-like [Saccoglossus kowalevskii]|uniref:Tetratricopeptide repeat protein 4-like n=1 Tax=Saccoglossus kowalevskii TaxID=10224 RepID=A0ABM0LY12_SACKO|nr:PREDICTED: tetratricopeptide repeat protein 4-like [Saccoglossus kowalevskii]